MAAELGTWAVAQMTPAAQVLFARQGEMPPSRASLGRLPKQMSPVWEEHRVEWEAAVREQETVPAEAATLALSLDGVMAPMRSEGTAALAAATPTAGSGVVRKKEVGCGTVSLYDAQGQRLKMTAYGRRPEAGKVSLKQEVTAEVGSILAVRPELTLVALADGARDDWRSLDQVWQHLCQLYPGLALVAVTLCWLVDDWPACQHLKPALEAYYGQGTRAARETFVALKARLKEEGGRAGHPRLGLSP